MNTCKTVNTLLLTDIPASEEYILHEITTGSERGMQYMQQLFHLELWYFATGFTGEQQAWDLALLAIKEHWGDQVAYDSLETLLEVVYITLVLHCVQLLQITDDGICIKSSTLNDAEFYSYLAQQKKTAAAYAARIRGPLQEIAPN